MQDATSLNIPSTVEISLFRRPWLLCSRRVRSACAYNMNAFIGRFTCCPLALFPILVIFGRATAAVFVLEATFTTPDKSANEDEGDDGEEVNGGNSLSAL